MCWSVTTHGADLSSLHTATLHMTCLLPPPRHSHCHNSGEKSQTLQFVFFWCYSVSNHTATTMPHQVYQESHPPHRRNPIKSLQFGLVLSYQCISVFGRGHRKRCAFGESRLVIVCGRGRWFFSPLGVTSSIVRYDLHSTGNWNSTHGLHQGPNQDLR